MKILIGEISSYKAIVIARFIKKTYNDIIVCTYDIDKRFNTIRTKYSDIHYLINPNYAEKELTELIKKEAIDYFFPVINSDLTRFIHQKENFKDALRYLGEFEPYEVLNNKDKLSDLAQSLGVRTPIKYETLKDAVIPFVVKPSNLSSAEGVHYIYNEKKRSEIQTDEHTIIQEFVEGIGVGYSFYAKDGVIVEGYGHKRLAEYPVSGGSSTYRTRYENSDMIAMASTIISNLNYTGFAMFEFKLTSENKLYLIEVNPRIWGSIHQGIADKNINYFEAILGPGTSKEKKKYRTTNTYAGPLVYLSLLGYLRKFQFRPIILFYSKIAFNRADVSILRDPKGYLSMIIRKLL